MEFQKCQAAGVTKKFKPGLWVCAEKAPCENRLYSKYAIPFCQVPLIDYLEKKEEKKNG